MIKIVFQRLLACLLFFAAAYACAWSGGLLFRYIVQNVKDIGVVFLPFQIFAVFLLGCMSLVSIVAGVMFLFSGGSDGGGGSQEENRREPDPVLGRTKAPFFSPN